MLYIYSCTNSGTKYLIVLCLFNCSLIYVDDISKDGTYTLSIFALYLSFSSFIFSLALNKLIPGLVAGLAVRRAGGGMDLYRKLGRL